MKIAGFTFIRNAVKNDYPVVEAITSILPICDEFVIAVGNSEDGTRELIEQINSPKIKIIDTIWDESLREGGHVFAAETDKAYRAISPDADWAFYIQGDECVHEKYLAGIKKEMEDNLADPEIEGLLFHYKHFYASYDYYAFSRRWYRKEIRAVKHLPGIHSYRDAQGFRINGRKIKVKQIDAFIYHYGWVKAPAGILNKMSNFNLYYNKDAVYTPASEDALFDYGNADKLIAFRETHPEAIIPRINSVNWKFSYDPTKIKSKNSFRRKCLQKLFELTGIRVGEYKNYKLVKH